MTAPPLTARDLRQSFGDRVLFDGLGFDLGPGEALVVRGPSGTGKTRLLRLLAWLDPGEGEIRLEGRTPVEWGVPRWRTRVAYVAQQPPVLSGSPADFARAVGSLRCQGQQRDARGIAGELGLADDQWHQRWQDLSGGERQRAHLAIVVATSPKVLLLDEPTSALDERSATAAEALLAPFAKVWVTHDTAQARRLGGRLLELE